MRNRTKSSVCMWYGEKVTARCSRSAAIVAVESAALTVKKMDLGTCNEHLFALQSHPGLVRKRQFHFDLNVPVSG